MTDPNRQPTRPSGLAVARRFVAVQGQADPHVQPAAEARIEQLDPCVVHQRRALHDGKPEAIAIAARAGLAMEALEQGMPAFGRDAHGRSDEVLHRPTMTDIAPRYTDHTGTRV